MLSPPDASFRAHYQSLVSSGVIEADAAQADAAHGFAELEARLGSPGFAAAASTGLRDRQVTALLEENERLSTLVARYRSSRSYRLGRFLTRLVSWRG